MCYNCGCQHHLAPLLSITPLSTCIQNIGITPCIVVHTIFVPSEVPVSSDLFLWGKLHPLSTLSCCKFWTKYQKSNHREISLLDVLESEDFCRFNKEFHMKSTSNWLLPRRPSSIFSSKIIITKYSRYLITQVQALNPKVKIQDFTMLEKLFEEGYKKCYIIVPLQCKSLNSV